MDKVLDGVTEHEESRSSRGQDDLKRQDGVHLAQEICSGEREEIDRQLSRLIEIMIYLIKFYSSRFI